MLKRKLFQHQAKAVDFISNRRFTLLADEMGLGKTLSALATTNPKEKTLIVAPKSLLLNWKNEIYNTHSLPNVQVVDSQNPPKLQYNGYILINYEQVSKYLAQLQAWHPDTLIIDESHYIKNINAKRTKNIIELSQYSGRIICLTGTPLLSRVGDLFTYFVLNKKLNPKDYYKFLNHFSHKQEKMIKGQKITEYVGIKNKEQLISLLKEFTLRRKKTDVVDLPPMIESIHLLSSYKDYSQELSLKDIARNIKLMTHISTIRHQTALKKVQDEALYGFLDDILEQTEKLVIFAHHQDVIQTLTLKLSSYNPLVITGQTSSQDRDYSLRLFKENPKHRILIISILAGGVGLNITNTSYAVFVELDWTHANMEQAKARLHRIGQAQTTNFYYVVYEGSVDHLLAKAIVNKELLTIAIHEGVEE